MAAFLIYIFRWALILTLFYSLYGLFLKRETLHSLNRVVLLVVLVGSMVLPLVQVQTKEGNIMTEVRQAVEAPLSSVVFEAWQDDDSYLRATSNHLVAEPDAPDGRMANPAERTVLVLIGLYLIGVVIAWTRYLWQLASLLLLIRQGRRVGIDGLPKGIKVLAHPAITTPCSWMRWVLLSPADASLLIRLPSSDGVGSGPAGGVLLHELSHIHYGHSWDMLLCELTCRMLWCVPFAWMLRQDLRDVHEFQADRRVLRSGIDENDYQLLLIRKATGTSLQPVANAFNQSPVKRRFIMMYRKPSRRWVALKAVYLLPLAALALVAFARPQTLSEIEKKVESVETEITQAIVEPGAIANVTSSAKGHELRRPEAEAVAEELEDEPDTVINFGNAYIVLENARVSADVNLVKADLAEHKEPVKMEVLALTVLDCKMLVDSVMQAVGARKIADGTFIGHFQPSLNNDTVRLSQAYIMDKQSQKMVSVDYDANKLDRYAYHLTLQAETRKDRKGYYIRYLQPVNSTIRNYDQRQVDPKMLTTDSVLTKRSSHRLLNFNPVAIELSKKETRLYMYIGFGADPQVEELKKRNYNMHHDFAIVDEQTGDKYMCRSTDYSYLKYVKDELVGKDTIKVYQTCLVFPPLAKRVKKVHLGSQNNGWHDSETFSLDAIPRKGRVITN